MIIALAAGLAGLLATTFRHGTGKRGLAYKTARHHADAPNAAETASQARGDGSTS
jgi:hypothetical protein